MKITETYIEDLFVIDREKYEDERGFFLESYRHSELGIDFVQDNMSFSTYGTIRGLHAQSQPYAQTKLVIAISGQIYDVAVDMRINSATFKQWFGIVLSGEKQLLIPKGFYHGFSVLSYEATILYKVDNYYNREHEIGIRYDSLDIDWMVKTPTVSDKDKKLNRL